MDGFQPPGMAQAPKLMKTTGRPRSDGGLQNGRWTKEEHDNFLLGITLHGRDWSKVAALVKTRTSAQIRSHAQKYYAKLQKSAAGARGAVAVDEKVVIARHNAAGVIEGNASLMAAQKRMGLPQQSGMNRFSHNPPHQNMPP